MSASFKLSRRDGWLLVLLTVLWGINWPVMKIGVQDFPALSFRTLCMAGGVPLLWLIARAQGHGVALAREHWRECLWLAMTNMTIWYVLSIYAVQMLSSGRAAILGYTMPVWTALIGWAVWRDRPQGRMGAGLLAAILAIGMLLVDEWRLLAGSPVGMALMLLAAMVWGLGTQLMRRRRMQVPVVVIAFWMMVISVIVCSVLSIVLEHDQWERWPNAIEWWAVAYNIVMVFGISQLLWFRLASVLPPVASSLSVMMIPVVGVFSGMAMLSEQPGWADLLALLCVLFAMACVLLPTRTR
ncbi:MAG: DMT family transporter [Burkholderiales bacterium]|jgi:drug/metabolite transporter (DMT)-like permease